MSPQPRPVAEFEDGRFAQLCPRPDCSGMLRPGIAMGQTLTGGALDFASDPGPVTLSTGGPERLIEVMKCPACGHSETGGSDG